MTPSSFAPRCAALLFAGYIVSSCPAHAEISKDLKFCAGLTSSKERLACYDAAARIEKRSTAVQQHATIPTFIVANPKRATPSAPQSVSRFDGAYVGGTLGYDINLANAGAVSNTYPYPYFPYSYPNVPVDSVHGTKVGLLAGYNATSGPLLIGFEARYQYNFNRTSASATNDYGTTALSFTTLSLTCYGCDPSSLDNYPINNVSPFNLRSITTSKIELSRPQQADIAFRAGLAHGDWLLFSKIGLGAEQVLSVSTTDSSASVVCNSPIAQRIRPDYNSAAIAVVGFGSTSPGPVTSVFSHSINPIAIFGAGFERNFGAYFARGEAEFVAHLDQAGAYYTPAINLTAGYRF